MTSDTNCFLSVWFFKTFSHRIAIYWSEMPQNEPRLERVLVKVCGWRFPCSIKSPYLSRAGNILPVCLYRFVKIVYSFNPVWIQYTWDLDPIILNQKKEDAQQQYRHCDFNHLLTFQRCVLKSKKIHIIFSHGWCTVSYQTICFFLH